MLTGRGRRRALRRLRHLPREQGAALLGSRYPSPRLRPLLFARLNEFLGRDLKRSGRVPHRASTGAGSRTPTIRSTATGSASRTRRAACACFDPDVLERAARDGDVLERIEERLPAEFERAHAARPGAVPRDHDLPRRLPAPLAGRPDADGALGRGPLPVPRLPRRRVRRRASRPAEGCAGSRRSTSSARSRRPLLPAEISARTKRPYRAPIASAFVGPARARLRPRAARRPSRLRGAGLFEPEAVARLVAQVRERRRARRRRDRRDGARRRDLDDAPPRAASSPARRSRRPPTRRASSSATPSASRCPSRRTWRPRPASHARAPPPPRQPPSLPPTRTAARTALVVDGRAALVRRAPRLVAALRARAPGSRARARRPRRRVHRQHAALRRLDLRDADRRRRLRRRQPADEGGQARVHPRRTARRPSSSRRGRIARVAARARGARAFGASRHQGRRRRAIEGMLSLEGLARGRRARRRATRARSRSTSPR